MMALGAVSPEVDGRMSGVVEALLALDQQISNDITLLGRQGASIDVLQDQNAAFATSISLLQADRITAEDDLAAEAWFVRAAGVQASGEALLTSIVGKRSRAVEMQRFMGLGWGLGTAVVAAGLAWWVWRKRGGKRRRRR